MTPARAIGVLLVLLLLAAPFLPLGASREYTIHVMVQIFIWSFIGGAWSLMGRFGLTSLGHGAFLGIGAYTTTLLWNFFGLTPWLGTLVAVAITGIFAVVVAYPCSRFQVVGHYFVRFPVTYVRERLFLSGTGGIEIGRARVDGLITRPDVLKDGAAMGLLIGLALTAVVLLLVAISRASSADRARG